MLRVFSGAALVIAGIAALVEAHSRYTAAYTSRDYRESLSEGGGHYETVRHAASGLSQNAYDALRIGGWALVIVGALLVVTGLIRYAAMQRGEAR
jgi:uncharacterized membrane protein YidH (DUF202 family)